MKEHHHPDQLHTSPVASTKLNAISHQTPNTKILFKKSHYLNCIIGRLTRTTQHHNSLIKTEGWNLNRGGKPRIHFLEKCRKPRHQGNTMLEHYDPYHCSQPSTSSHLDVPHLVVSFLLHPKSDHHQCLFPSHFSAHCLIHYTTLISFLSHRNSPPHSTEAPTPLLPLPQYCNHQFCPSLYTWTSYSRWDSPLYRSMQLILPQTALKTDTNLLHNTVTPTRCLIPQNEKFLNQSDVELCALPSNKINTGL